MKQYVLAALLVVVISSLFIGYRFFSVQTESQSTVLAEKPAEKPASGFSSTVCRWSKLNSLGSRLSLRPGQRTTLCRNLK